MPYRVAEGQYRCPATAPQVTDVALTKSQRLCAIDEIPDGGAHAAEALIDGVPEALLLLRRGERIEAFHNICPHAGRRLDWAPGRFLIDSGLIVCAAHGASFSVPDGQCVAGPCRGQTLLPVPIALRDGDVFLA
jgi:nitrite reductase/ring-hydroxylating ferredoxin subunit